MNKSIIIAPSILSADFTKLGSEISEVIAGGSDWIHVDVMDGEFVPNITIGMPVVKSIRKYTNAFLDVHLMVDRPHRYVKNFCDAGADLVTFHVEALEPQDLLDAIKIVRGCGKPAGLCIKPKTPATVLLPYLDMIDVALVMTVEPGFGGQKFMEDLMPKITSLRQMLDEINPDCIIEVDGGIDSNTILTAKNAGANAFVAGSAVFGKTDRAAAITALRNAAQ